MSKPAPWLLLLALLPPPLVQAAPPALELGPLEASLRRLEAPGDRDAGWLGEHRRLQVLGAMRALAVAEARARELALDPYGAALDQGLEAARLAPGPRLAALRLRLARLRFGDAGALAHLAAGPHRVGRYPPEAVATGLRTPGRPGPADPTEASLLPGGVWLLVDRRGSAWACPAGGPPTRLALPAASGELLDLGLGGVLRAPAGPAPFALVRRLGGSPGPTRQLLVFLPQGAGYRSAGVLPTTLPDSRVRLWVERDGERVLGWRLHEGEPGDLERVTWYRMEAGRLRPASPAGAHRAPLRLRLY